MKPGQNGIKRIHEKLNTFVANLWIREDVNPQVWNLTRAQKIKITNDLIIHFDLRNAKIQQSNGYMPAF